jgi:uncharacterized membrane protein
MKRLGGFLLGGSGFALILVLGAYIQVHGSTARPAPSMPVAGEGLQYDYRILATNKTSTMEKEMNMAAQAGYRFEAAMGGETAFGGSEAVAVMARSAETGAKQRYEYRLLATSKTSTMQKELQEAGNAGFTYRDQTVFKTTFGGKEVVVILERDGEAPKQQYEYKLLATSRTATMEKELRQAGEAGFQFLGITVAQTAIGGSEVVSILRRPASK